MGAFGELLIQKWGGNLNNYNGNKTTKQESVIGDETPPNKEESLRQLKILKARKYLSSLTSSLIYTPQEAKNYTEESIKTGFKKLGFDGDVQNIMWDEYCLFVEKYT